jgi:hypothetical protein
VARSLALTAISSRQGRGGWVVIEKMLALLAGAASLSPALAHGRVSSESSVTARPVRSANRHRGESDARGAPADASEMQARRASDVSHHLFISGTGRAGTTLLVRYLTALGLDTHLSRNPHSRLNENAHAGLEDLPIKGDLADMPYVMKSPWLYEFADQLLADRRIKIDALILPIRDLMEAATSRVVLEMRNIHERSPWMAEIDASWSTTGETPGGMVHALNAVDQARILAVGFHTIVERFVKADIPIIFIHFPKLVEDGGYLFEKLQPYLPPGVTRQQALDAHRSIVDLAKVRVGHEIHPEGPARDPQHELYDRLALAREVVRLKNKDYLTRTKQFTHAAGKSLLRVVAGGMF